MGCVSEYLQSQTLRVADQRSHYCGLLCQNKKKFVCLAASNCSTWAFEGKFLCLVFRAANAVSRFVMSISLSFLSLVTIQIILPLLVALWAAQRTSGEMSSTLFRWKYSFREFSISVVLMGSLRIDLLSHQCVPDIRVRVFCKVRRTNEWSDQTVSMMVALCVEGIRLGDTRIWFIHRTGGGEE